MSRLHRAARWAARRIGWRGDVLLTFAAVDVVYGWALFSATPVVLDSNATYRWFNEIAPLKAWAGLWWLVAVICTVAAFQHDDRIGYAAAVGIKTVWGLTCLAGWIMSDVSPASAAIWLGFTRIVWRFAGWTEPDHEAEDGS